MRGSALLLLLLVVGCSSEDPYQPLYAVVSHGESDCPGGQLYVLVQNYAAGNQRTVCVDGARFACPLADGDAGALTDTRWSDDRSTVTCSYRASPHRAPIEAREP